MENNNKIVYIENSMGGSDSSQTSPVEPTDDKPLTQTTGLMGDIGSSFSDAIGFNGNTKNVGSMYNEQIGSTFNDRIGYNSSEEDDKHRSDAIVPSNNSVDEGTMEEGDPLIIGGGRKNDTDDDTCSEAGTHTDTESSICSKDIMEIDPFVVRLKMFLATDDGKSITTILQDVLCELKKLNNNLEKK